MTIVYTHIYGIKGERRDFFGAAERRFLLPVLPKDCREADCPHVARCTNQGRPFDTSEADAVERGKFAELLF